MDSRSHIHCTSFESQLLVSPDLLHQWLLFLWVSKPWEFLKRFIYSSGKIKQTNKNLKPYLKTTTKQKPCFWRCSRGHTFQVNGPPKQKKFPQGLERGVCYCIKSETWLWMSRDSTSTYVYVIWCSEEKCSSFLTSFCDWFGFGFGFSKWRVFWCSLDWPRLAI